MPPARFPNRHSKCFERTGRAPTPRDRLSRQLRGAAFLAAGLAQAAGCGFHEADSHWTDQLSPSGACWEVDLGDGLDEDSTDELHALFECLDQGGNLDPLSEVVVALDGLGRDGSPLGSDLASLVNRLPDTGIDPFALFGLVLELIEPGVDGDRPLTVLLEAGVELLYGESYGVVLSGIQLRSETALDHGAVRPLLPVVAEVAARVLDDGGAVPELAVKLLRDDVVADGLCTAIGLSNTADADAAELGARLLPDLGAALEQTTEPSNDRWAGATGDSARDLATTLMLDTAGDARTPMQALAVDLVPMLEDDQLAGAARGVLRDSSEAGRLAPLAQQIAWLASVDRNGTPLEAASGADSALASLLRLVAEGNTDVQCSLDLWVTSLDIDLGNLSVAILTVLSEQDPDAVQGGVDVLGSVLGWPFSEATLDAIAASGVCPAVDEQLVADLQALDRLSDPEAADLVALLLDVLSAAHLDAREDRLPSVVDAVTTLHGRGVVPPLEELSRDLGDSALAADVAELAVLLLDPSVLNVADCPTGSAPIDFDGAWGLLLAALSPQDGGEAPIDQLAPVLHAALDDDGTWSAVHSVGTLLRQPESRLHDLPALLGDAVRVDPELDAIEALAAVLSEPALREPAMRLAENRPLVDAVGRAELAAEGPLPFGARLVTGGTLASLLRTVDLLLDALRASREAR